MIKKVIALVFVSFFVMSGITVLSEPQNNVNVNQNNLNPNLINPMTSFITKSYTVNSITYYNYTYVYVWDNKVIYFNYPSLMNIKNLQTGSIIQKATYNYTYDIIFSNGYMFIESGNDAPAYIYDFYNYTSTIFYSGNAIYGNAGFFSYDNYSTIVLGVYSSKNYYAFFIYHYLTLIASNGEAVSTALNIQYYANFLYGYAEANNNYWYFNISTTTIYSIANQVNNKQSGLTHINNLHSLEYNKWTFVYTSNYSLNYVSPNNNLNYSPNGAYEYSYINLMENYNQINVYNISYNITNSINYGINPFIQNFYLNGQNLNLLLNNSVSGYYALFDITLEAYHLSINSKVKITDSLINNYFLLNGNIINYPYSIIFQNPLTIQPLNYSIYNYNGSTIYITSSDFNSNGYYNLTIYYTQVQPPPIPLYDIFTYMYPISIIGLFVGMGAFIFTIKKRGYKI